MHKCEFTTFKTIDNLNTVFQNMNLKIMVSIKKKKVNLYINVINKILPWNQILTCDV